MNKTKLFIVGSMGSGKSTLGNKLIGSNVFTSGTQIESVTCEIQKAVSEKYVIIDCPGFGDNNEKKLFFEQVLRRKYRLIVFYNQLKTFLIRLVKMD